MFEKIYPDGSKVVIENGVIALYRANGEQATNSNVDYYYEESGYGCKSEEEAADVYHRNFAAGATLGSIKSARKAKSSRENGRKGGRPRRVRKDVRQK